MSAQELQIQELVKSMPVEAVNKILDYALYVKYSLTDIDIDIEKCEDSEEFSFIGRSKEELYKKLEQARKSEEEGNVYTLEEVFAELETV